MPILRSIDIKRNLVTLTCSGAIEKGGIRTAFFEMLDDPAFRQGANVLWDFRDAQGVAPSENSKYSILSL